MNPEIIRQYFPQLTTLQSKRFDYLGEFYREWNSKINLISRKDIDNLYENHILHSLSIAKIIQFQSFTHVLDIGTGGGFPGIPLAILFPKSRFHLIDSIQKKIKVVNTLVEELELQNVTAEHKRVQQVHGKTYDFVVSRGVTKLPQLMEWTKKLVTKEHYNTLKNGLIVLKGGNLEAEIKTSKRRVKVFPIKDFYTLDFYAEKYVLHVAV
ncbi:MAG: 16S rRNA (guanine(527)-N(7))-methyltransferase RsmG [Chitinophagales bacterium]